MFFLAFAESIQLLPDGTMFIHIVLILVMIWILNRTFFRPINEVIKSRDKTQGGRFTEAERILRKVGKKHAEVDAALLEARSESYELIERERKEAVSMRDAELSMVKDEVAGMVAGEYDELAQQTAQARAVISEDAERMAEKISANILKAA